jgi:hypothetical protein
MDGMRGFLVSGAAWLAAATLPGAMMVGAAGCGGGSSGGVDYCSTPSKCGGDPAPSQNTINQCNRQVNDPTCGAKFTAAEQCEYQNLQCDMSNMTVRPNPASDPCTPLNQAWLACMFPTLDGGAGD